MAEYTYTLSPGAGFSPGETVEVYPQLKPGLPSGGPTFAAPITSAVAAADGSVTFTGLQPNKSYLAYADRGTQHKWVSFSTYRDRAYRDQGGAGAEEIAALESRIGVVEGNMLSLQGSYVAYSTDPDERPDAPLVIFVTATEPTVARTNDVWVEAPMRTEVLRNAVRDPHATGTTWWTAPAGVSLSLYVGDSDDGDGTCIQATRLIAAAGTQTYVAPTRTLDSPSESDGWLACQPGDSVLGIGSLQPISILGATFEYAALVFAFYRADLTWITDITAGRIDKPGTRVWHRLAAVVTAPAEAAFVHVRPQVQHDSTDTSVIRVDRCLAAVVPPDTEADPNLFFSGSGYTDPATGLWIPDPLHKRVAWEGEENASPSVMYMGGGG